MPKSSLFFFSQALYCTYRKHLTELTKIKQISYAYYLGFKICASRRSMYRKKNSEVFPTKSSLAVLSLKKNVRKKPCFRNWAGDIGMTSKISGVSPNFPLQSESLKIWSKWREKSQTWAGFFLWTWHEKSCKKLVFPVALLRQIPDSRGPKRLCSVWRCAWFAEISILWSSSSLEQEVFPPPRGGSSVSCHAACHTRRHSLCDA